MELVSLADIPSIPEPEETGRTFEDNARLKALYYAEHAQLPTVAEDSGLVVDALDGEPGVQSARFLGPAATYPERFHEIYRRLAARSDAPRTARFVCALAFVRDGGVAFETTMTVEGEIAATPSGTAGFGYDPIFYFPPYGTTLADVDQEAKLRVAHRGKAFRAFADWLAEHGRGESTWMMDGPKGA
jgi:non-canonical purine NTP pyrophosphatase (RdgB/HAM1 family)